MTPTQHLHTTVRGVDCQHVVSVDEHKTTACYGPTKIVPAPALHSWMKIYILQPFAHRCQRPVKQNLFLYWKGDSLSSAQITLWRLNRKTLWHNARRHPFLRRRWVVNCLCVINCYPILLVVSS